MIVDVHSHIGWDEIFHYDFREEHLLGAQRGHGVAVTIVQPALVVSLEAARVLHDRVARLAAAHPGRFYGMANPNPHTPEADYRREVERCITELGFVGIKIHTMAHALPPDSPAGRRAFDAARDLGVPVMIHTGAGIPWANPALVAPAAARYPDVKIVLAHSGMHVLTAEAIEVARAHGNVYLETSWTPGFLIRAWVGELGAGRVLWGSDHALDNTACEIVKVRTCGLTPGEQGWVLGHTALRVYDRIRTG